MIDRKRPFIVDVEASGFGQFSYPIEIGLALSKNERYCSLIYPSKNWTYWDEKAEKIHKINRKTLINYGKSIKQVAEELNTILENTIVYTDGWVVDKPWITKLFHDSGISRSFSVSPLERILSEAQMEIWHQTKDTIIKQFSLKRHRASTDAFLIQETYFRTFKEII